MFRALKDFKPMVPKKLLPCVLGGVLSLPALSFSQTIYTTANTPYPLENLGHSPRASALGEAFTAVSGDPACLFYNPAGLGGLDSFQLSLVHEDWIAGISQETLLAGFPTGKIGGFALGANYLDFGPLEGYDALGNPTSSNHPFRGSLSLGWGSPWFSGFSVGLSVQGLFQSLAPGISNLSSSLQAGALWNPFSNFDLGASYTFLNTDSQLGVGFLGVGASWSTLLLFKNPTLLESTFSLPLYNVARLQFGAEQPFLNVLVARLGYQWELNNNYIAGFRGLTGGLGFDFQDFSLDYSYAPDGDLGFSQMVGLTYRLPSPASRPPIPHPTPVSTPSPTQTPKPTPVPAKTFLFPSPTPVSTRLPTPASPSVTPSPENLQVPSPTNTAVVSNKPSPSPTITSLNFSPSSTQLPSDQVVKVETFFQIPDTVESPVSASSTPSPELEKALDEAGQKVGQNPNDAQAWMDLGNLYWQSGQPDYAIQCFTEVLRLKPGAQALKDWMARYRQSHPVSPGGE